MKIFTIAGWSESGKTTLITRLIEAFRHRGRKVAAVKHAPDGYDVQLQAKDSQRFLAAGAAEAFIVSASSLVRIAPLAEGQDPFPMLQALLDGQDIVFMEGICREGIPVIEVWKPSCHDKPKFPLESLAAVVSDAEIAAPVPSFKEQNLDDIVRFIEEYNGTKGRTESERQECAPERIRAEGHRRSHRRAGRKLKRPARRDPHHRSRR